MDVNKICFIMCVNDEQYMRESAYYISQLDVPEGYAIDILTVQDARCMTAGYNEAMRQSDAKYKVYLHQDVLIVEKDFINHLLRIFENPHIGMIGMVGVPELPEHGVMWYGKRDNRIGKLYTSNIYLAGEGDFVEVNREYQEVEAIDGLLMATQYDIPWRDDIFTKWDFYDASQSLEFRRQGYKVVVPKMEKPWCIHDDGFMNLENYYDERKKFLKEYNWGTQSKENVSVIIPTYNRAHLIERSIRSVLNQTYENFELLVIDDGSTDNTQEVVEAIRDDRIRYIRCEENGGAAKARNRGIAEAKYDYIAFQDSDDEWHTDKLERQMKVLTEASEDVGLVYCEYHYNGLNGLEDISPNRDIPLEQKSGNIFPQLLSGNMIGTPVMLVKKECFEKVGVFNENFPCMEDYELVLRIAKEYRIEFIPEVLMEVYANYQSVTNNLEGFLTTRCILAGAYKKELLEYGMFDVIVGSIIDKAKEFNLLDSIVKYLEAVMTK